MDDVLVTFGNAIRDAQLVLEGDPIMDGTRQRIPAAGGKNGNLAGSYIGWRNGVRPAGSIENFLTGTKENWKYQGDEKIAPLSLEQVAEMAADRERRAKELQTQYEDRALAAVRRWSRAQDMVSGETTPYLDRKRVPAVGLRREGENLLVPLRDVDRKLWSIQTVFPEKKALTQNGAPIDKVMSKGAKKSGNFHVLGIVRAGTPVLVAEGYATGATGHIATDYATVVAIDSGNLDDVVGTIKGRYPDIPIVILGDDDRHGKRNVGREKAEAAAQKYQVGVVFPRFATEGKFTDFNDLHVSEGLDAAKLQIEHAVKLQIEQSLPIYSTRSETMSKQDESDRSPAATGAGTGPLPELAAPALNSEVDALNAMATKSTGTSKAALLPGIPPSPPPSAPEDKLTKLARNAKPEVRAPVQQALRDHVERARAESIPEPTGKAVDKDPGFGESGAFNINDQWSTAVRYDAKMIGGQISALSVKFTNGRKQVAAVNFKNRDMAVDVLGERNVVNIEAGLGKDATQDKPVVKVDKGPRPSKDETLAAVIADLVSLSRLERGPEQVTAGVKMTEAAIANPDYRQALRDELANVRGHVVVTGAELKRRRETTSRGADMPAPHSYADGYGAANVALNHADDALALEAKTSYSKGKLQAEHLAFRKAYTLDRKAETAERSSIDAGPLDEIKDNTYMMLSAPEGAVTSREAITVVADDLQLLDRIPALEQRERALLLMQESCHAQEGYASQFVDMAALEVQAEMAAAVQARKAQLAAEEAPNNKLQAGIQREAEHTMTAGNAVEMLAVRALDAEQTTLDAQRMVEISANANAMANAPEGAITPDEATIMVAHDLKLLGEMATPHLHERALWVMAESRKAQSAYKTQFTRLAPPELHQLMAAAVTARAAEFRKWDVVDRALEEGAQKNADSVQAGAPGLNAGRAALDAQTHKQLEDARERDRKAVENSIIEARREVGKWTGANTIEHVDAQERNPFAPPSVNLAKQEPKLAVDGPAPPALDSTLTMIPPEVEKVYLRDGHKFYHPKNQQRVAFEDYGKKLKTAHSTGPVALAMVQIAEARGWKEIKVSGTEEFRKEAWREAALRGLGVQGYKPTALDVADLARRTPKKDVENVVAPTPQATRHGVYISADDAALLAAVKAAGSDTAQAHIAAPIAQAPRAVPVTHAGPVKPATVAAQGDVLVAHGAARYEHNKDNPMSYFVTVANDQGKQRTIWGVKLGEAMEKSGVKPGDRISLIKNGETQVEVDANVKNDKGVVIAMERIDAKRNEWAVKAHAFATQPAEQVVQVHKDLAGVVAIAAAIDQQAHADGYKPNERAYIEQRVREIATRSIASGNAPTLLYREAVESTKQPQQELMR